MLAVKRQLELEHDHQDQRHAEEITQALVHDSSFPPLMELDAQSPQDVTPTMSSTPP